MSRLQRGLTSLNPLYMWTLLSTSTLKLCCRPSQTVGYLMGFLAFSPDISTIRLKLRREFFSGCHGCCLLNQCLRPWIGWNQHTCMCVLHKTQLIMVCCLEKIANFLTLRDSWWSFSQCLGRKASRYDLKSEILLFKFGDHWTFYYCTIFTMAQVG